MPLLSGTLAMLAKGALTAVIAPFVEESRDVALNAAQDAIRNTVTGRMSVNEWADIIIESVDKHDFTTLKMISLLPNQLLQGVNHSI